MKKHLCLLVLAAISLAALSACGGGGTVPTTAAPAAETTAAPSETETEPDETDRPPYQTYDYAYGGVRIGVPWSLPEEPEDNGDSITFSDPEGAWRVTFKPLTLTTAPLQARNLAALMGNFSTMGYYQNVDSGETKLGDVDALYYRFERNPDWDPATQGYTTSYEEPHALYFIDYGDKVIAGFGGMLINVAAPEKSTGDLEAILSDEDVQTLLGHLMFQEGDEMQKVSFPGLEVSFPARWIAGTDGDHTLWAGMQGSDTKGSVYFGSSIYADPEEAAGYVSPDYRTLDFGGRSWYGAVRSSELGETVLKSLELYTAYTDYHALYMRLNLNDWRGDDAEFWAYTETEDFQDIMGSVEMDPEAFHNPEDDRKDDAGFECNNVNEISAYTGTDSEITIPASIGTNEILGINSGVFKDNTTLRSVVIPEGISYIETDAFQGCTNLETVVLPNSLTLIDSRAFEGCTALSSVTFGENLSEIGNDAFANCGSLGDLSLPATVATIGITAFSNSGDGTGNFSCPADGTVYMHMAFSDARFKTVEIGTNADLSDYNIMQGFIGETVRIGEGTEAIGDYFLIAGEGDDTVLTKVETPATLKSIGEHAFDGRRGLQEFDFASLESMGEGAFERTGLLDITIPGTLKEVPRDAFSRCPDVENIHFGEGVEVIGAYAFSSLGDGKEKMETYNFLTDEEVEEHKDVVHVDDPDYIRFYDISLPQSIQKVEDGAFLGTRLDGLYLEWLESVDQLPEDIHDFMPGFNTYECIYVTPETLEAQGDALDAYFAQDESFATRWHGKVRVFEGRHHYWTDEELGIDA